MGLSTIGNRNELLERLLQAYRLKIELVGSGELSDYGKRMCIMIFDMFDSDKDGALSLWEMNELLHRLGSATISDQREYQRIMTANSFLTNESGNITKEGLCAYYEKYGKLADDVRTLGLGSIDAILQGELNVSVDYDAEAIKTAFPLFEKHTLAQRYIKKLLYSISSVKSMTWDAEVDKLSDLFDIFQDLGISDYITILLGSQEKYEWLKHILREPGIFVDNLNIPVTNHTSSGMADGLLNSFSEWLADGELGVLREMKRKAAELVSWHELSIYALHNLC
jgi:hypothetical protein